MSAKLFTIVLALSVCALSACKPKEGPPPNPTPVATVVPPDPTPTSSPLPEIVPCHAVPPSPGIYTGDCEITAQCHDNGGGTYAGQCHTRPQ